MNKYGIENFAFEIIKSDKSRENIANLEIEYIKKYKTQDSNFGYNLASGGEINTSFTIPKEVRDKKSKEMMGSNNTFYGKKHSEETKQKIRDAKLGKKLSEETKQKMRGRTSPLKNVTGENHPCFNRKRTEDEKFRIMKNTPHRKNVNMIDSKTNEVVMTFNSKKEAGRWLHDNGHCSSNNPRSIMSTINRAIKLNTISYGYKWGETKESQSTIETTLKTEGSRVG